MVGPKVPEWYCTGELKSMTLGFRVQGLRKRSRKQSKTIAAIMAMT